MDYVIHFWVYWEALQVAAVRVPHLSNYATAKYQRLIQFTIGPHSIYIQARWDLNKQWLPLAYKVTDEELDALIQEWPAEWCNLVSQEELSKELVVDALDKPIQKELSVHNSDNESSMDLDVEE